VGTAGTPAGRLPTTADTVVIIAAMTTPYSGGTWSGLVTVDTAGTLGGGTYSNTITAYGLVSSCTFNGIFEYNQSYDAINCTFNGQLQPVSSGFLRVGSGCVVNGTITAGGTINISGGTFNTAIPSRFTNYTLSGGIFDRDLNLGDPLGSTAGQPQRVQLDAGLATGRNINIDISKYVFNVFLGRNIGGGLTINGGSYTGLISVIKTDYSPDASGRPPIVITGGSYSPPAVQTPAIKSGNYMTFTSSAIPKDWGFAVGGGTFNPTIQLTGTSNEILGSGLL